jgi:hypothetical protein
VSLTPCSDLSAADWITGSDLPWQQLVTFGPRKFRTYARLRFLPDPTSAELREPSLGSDAPDEYDLLGIALEVLGEHTRSPGAVYFCVWDGWETTPALRDAPKVEVPARSYFMFRGALADFGTWRGPDMAPIRPGNHAPLPAFIWPSDHAWCIANDVDPHYAGIGCSPEAIAQLLAHPALDVVPADPSEQQPHYM